MIKMKTFLRLNMRGDRRSRRTTAHAHVLIIHLLRYSSLACRRNEDLVSDSVWLSNVWIWEKRAAFCGIYAAVDVGLRNRHNKKAIIMSPSNAFKYC